jgi:phospholipase/carboxylesterase
MPDEAPTCAPLATVEVAVGRAPPRLAVIWLHGLGADGHDFEPIVPELALTFPVRFVFPHAPVRPVTINQGMAMRAWFDIYGFGADYREDEAGIRESAAAVGALVDRELARGLGSEQIVLAGFSQGGAIALHAALREPRKLGGVVALSTYLPLAGALAAERAAANANVPILMAHGAADPVVPIALAERSCALLTRAGYAVDWRVYPMAHSVCAEEIAAIADFLREIAAP